MIDILNEQSETELKKRIESLPSGYISHKTISGKVYSYYQWRENGRVRSKYLKKDEAEQMEIQLAEKYELQKTLKDREMLRRLEVYRRENLGKRVSVGIQNYAKLVENNLFYVDKTDFIRQWWNNCDEVTLITRPRRFGKTLTLSMVEYFFSVKFAGRNDLFEKMNIWKNASYRSLQGTYPVISISFSGIKDRNFEDIRSSVCWLIDDCYRKLIRSLDKNILFGADAVYQQKEINEISDILLHHQENTAVLEKSLRILSDILYNYYGKKVIILFDEYDTPLQQAYFGNCYDQTAELLRRLFNYTFKSNPSMERALITGIARVGKESLFSDMNHLRVCSMFEDDYSSCFGFTEQEVFAALEAQHIGTVTVKNDVKKWYDGFSVGKQKDIYNPWSIINYLRSHDYQAYWVNSSSNELVGTLIAGTDIVFREQVQLLLEGKSAECCLDKEVDFRNLEREESVIWSLLLSSGYIKTDECIIPECDTDDGKAVYRISLTNMEVAQMMHRIVRVWFDNSGPAYNEFIRCLLDNDLSGMNEYMNEISQSVFSVFDCPGSGLHRNTGAYARKKQPERFYHGFVLGLLVNLRTEYIIKSNRESGLGRYDVSLFPKDKKKNGYVLEFKVFDPKIEKSPAETVQKALKQIQDRQYISELEDYGIDKGRIYCYGFSFDGKNALIGML